MATDLLELLSRQDREKGRNNPNNNKDTDAAK
jgi:hypothetical protein